jgi:tetratricopeptide (TPR) repeat protein
LFKKAIEFDYSNTYVDLNNGIDLLKSKKFTECLEYFEKVLVVEPNNLEAYYNKVINYCI